MTTITYGKSVFQGNARTRRRERRRKEAAERDIIFNIIDSIFGLKKEHQTLPLKRNNVDRVAKSLIARDTKVCDSLDNCCIPQVALYHAGNRSIRKAATHILK